MKILRDLRRGIKRLYKKGRDSNFFVVVFVVVMMLILIATSVIPYLL